MSKLSLSLVIILWMGFCANAQSEEQVKDILVNDWLLWSADQVTEEEVYKSERGVSLKKSSRSSRLSIGEDGVCVLTHKRVGQSPCPVGRPAINRSLGNWILLKEDGEWKLKFLFKHFSKTYKITQLNMSWLRLQPEY